MFVIVAFARNRYFCSTASTPMSRNSASFCTFSLVCQGLTDSDQALFAASLFGYWKIRTRLGAGGVPSMVVALL